MFIFLKCYHLVIISLGILRTRQKGLDMGCISHNFGDENVILLCYGLKI